MRKPSRRTAAAAAVALSALLAGPVHAAAAPAADRGSAPAVQLPGELLEAVQHDTGLPRDEAVELVEQQQRAAEVDRALRGTLGRHLAGTWFDAESGRLVAGIADARWADEVAAAGAVPRVSEHSGDDLRAIVDRLDRLAGYRGDRSAAGERSSRVDGLVGWYVDPAANSVVVTALEGEGEAAAARLRERHGGAVRIEYAADAPVTTADYMDGGDAVGRSGGAICSAGFNLRNHDTGQGYLLTAGHCFDTGESVYGWGDGTGVYFGPVLESWFPNQDDALVRNDSSGRWIQGPWVDTDPSNGPVVTVGGTSDSPVGTWICSSGITTKRTCGRITGKDETVTYSGGSTVYGLTRHNACVEPGDSGGSAYRPSSSGNTAEGVNSGASLSNGQCLEKVGEENVSWYFPVVDSLAYYGPKYNVGMW